MKSVAVPKFDAILWGKVWRAITDSGEFESLIAARIEALKAQEIDAAAERERLQNRLDDIAMGRQWVITQARTGKITDADMELQLGALAIEQAGLERELNGNRLLIGNRAERLIELAELYRCQVLEGAEGLNGKPTSAEHARRQFELRRKFIDGLVTRIDLRPDCDMTIQVDINFGELLAAAQNNVPLAS
jgi:hypothetical protein